MAKATPKKRISKRLEKAMNTQIVNEFHSSHAYLNIASYFDSLGLKILAANFFNQSEEEREHALKLFKYLLDIGGDAQVGPIPESKVEFKSPEDAIRCALAQEELVTDQINDLMKTAHEDNDYAATSFLRWFVDEQVEELATVNDLLDLVRHAGDNLLLVEERLMRMGITAEPTTVE